MDPMVKNLAKLAISDSSMDDESFEHPKIDIESELATFDPETKFLVSSHLKEWSNNSGEHAAVPRSSTENPPISASRPVARVSPVAASQPPVTSPSRTKNRSLSSDKPESTPRQQKPKKPISEDEVDILLRKMKNFFKSKPFIIGASTVLCAGGAIVAAPFVAGAMGFTAAGIQAGSLAASMMSSMGGAFTASGSTVAILQSVGATGTVLGSTVATGVAAGVGGAVGATASGIATAVADSNQTKSDNDRSEMEKECLEEGDLDEKQELEIMRNLLDCDPETRRNVIRYVLENRKSAGKRLVDFCLRLKRIEII
uniref:Uncharacterized protein n=1 Tax=Bracon brevicornis TaxID=1563983 RepID=A0A6V7JAN8_9HYME